MISCTVLAFEIKSSIWISARINLLDICYLSENKKSNTQGWKLDEITGTLTAFQLERKDEGEYTCIAENNAGRLESAAYLKA